MNNIYYSLSKISFLKNNYSLKFLFVAFLGIHIPLIGIIIYSLNTSSISLNKNVMIMIALVFTLLATVITLYTLKCLLKPLIISKNALTDYLNNKELPVLPTEYTDEAGTLMYFVQKTLTSLDGLIKEKQEITTLVSHNLRTPLNQILGLCELMRLDSENSSSYIDKVESITKLQLQGLSELLVQLMQTKLLSNESVYDINELIKQEIELADFDIQRKKINIKLSLQDTPLITNVSKNKVALVIQNLLSNAIKFSYEGEDIEISTSTDSNNKIEILVDDNGIGFSSQYKQNLFKDARNIGRKGTNNEPSVGLGLHLCKRTINQLGGELLAYSDGEEKGATFKIII